MARFGLWGLWTCLVRRGKVGGEAGAVPGIACRGIGLTRTATSLRQRLRRGTRERITSREISIVHRSCLPIFFRYDSYLTPASSGHPQGGD